MAGGKSRKTKRSKKPAKAKRPRAREKRNVPAGGARKPAVPNADSPASRPVLSEAEKVDRDLVRAALEKQQGGQQPTSRELEALRRWERAKEERLRWQYYATIPHKHVRTMSGRQSKVINEMALRYGIPFAGATVDLRAIVKALFDFLADYGPRLAVANGDDPLLDGPASPALERYRNARANREEFAFQRDLGEWIARDQVHDALGQLSAILRNAGELLQRQFGADAHAILDEALADFDRKLESFVGAVEDSDDR